MAKINQLDKLDRVAKLLPPLLVYHYFDWAFKTQDRIDEREQVR